jgi:cellulose synthase/poly-beta-1,6-N-acetylglucosamine synthase-like glycosyltransferase
MVWNITLFLFAVSLVGMAIFGVYSGWMLLRSKPVEPVCPPASSNPKDVSEWPVVTVQLPIFNERYVAERVVRAAAALDWPRERLQIQVLDDSTDDTAELTRQLVAELQAAGFDIEHQHRTDRRGYKAGALAAAMPRVRGEFIAMFDADFVPSPDWLRRIVIDAQAFAHPRTGFAQTRWSYLNREHSLLTRAQGMMHDVHFYVEQTVRSQAGLWFNFNGSGGLWRKTCVEDAGGWQEDTLTEDLDLSYRAALRGWHGVYRADIDAPNELPERVLAFKRQQARWARGSIQTARKLLGVIWCSPAKLQLKLFASLHLCAYTMHPLLVVFMLTWPIVTLFVIEGMGLTMPFWAHVLAPTSLGFFLGFPLVQYRYGRAWRRILPELALTLIIGVGVSASNSLAVLRGLVGRDAGEFVRTPKRGTQTAARRYRLGLDATLVAEFALALWLGGCAWIMAARGSWWALSCGVYSACYFHFIVRQLWESQSGRRGADVSLAATSFNTGS